MYSWMLTRAVRVEVDVKLALGEMNVEEAAAHMATSIPMDYPTALHEAGLFTADPGQAISYLIGKLQIINMLADARRIRGDGFRLRDFHDYVWKNGNVPIALQRWEHLGLDDELAALDGSSGAVQ
jgi:uncharacterized protein (DUF885 family)